MKISNPLHFTENDPFQVYRDFSLSSVDHKMLNTIYQPMIGSGAVSLFHLLFQQVPTDQIGYSRLEQQRKLFLTLDLEPNDRGRRQLIDSASRLEAVGLMQTFRKYSDGREEYIYEYQLNHPLTPAEFFKNQHLTMLLRDKVGKYEVLSLQGQFYANVPVEHPDTAHDRENLSVPFYELFRLNARVVDYELEQALLEAAPAREAAAASPYAADSEDYRYADSSVRFPKDSANRRHVERLKFRSEQLAAVNYVAGKHFLTLQETCRMLDEDGIFTEDGELKIDALQRVAYLNYRQDKKRDDERERYLLKSLAVRREESAAESGYEEKAVDASSYLNIPEGFQSQCDIHQYNMLLRNEPYTGVLKRFFPGSVPDRILDVFAKIDMNYKLKEEVINVLIHHLKTNNLSWTKAYIESIASDMLGKRIDSFEQAVEYIRGGKDKQQAPRAPRSSFRAGGKRKPKISMISEGLAPSPLTEEEREEMKKLAVKLGGNDHH